jgi:hypothetical protein
MPENHSMTDLIRVSLDSLPPDRRGRLRNGAAPGDYLAASRCGARTRGGGRCHQPAMKNGRCRMHGGLSTGPRTPAGRARCAAARRTHGFYAAETVALRREASSRIRRLRALVASVNARSTAGHGVLPSSSRKHPAEGGGRRASRPQILPQPVPHGMAGRGFCPPSSVLRPLPAGHEVLPSLSMPAPDAARPLRRPAPRLGFVQRTLLGSTALGLGLTVAPPAAAGHVVLPSLSLFPPAVPPSKGSQRPPA